MGAALINDPNVFYFLFAFGNGIGQGIIYPAPLQSCWKQMPSRRGLVTGVVFAGQGVGAFVSGYFCRTFLNPENDPSFFEEVEPQIYDRYFDIEISAKVPTVLMIFCGFWTVLIIIALLTLKHRQSWRDAFFEVTGRCSEDDLLEDLMNKKNTLDFEPDESR